MNGYILATGGEDHRLVLRDPLTFEPLLSLPNWSGHVRDLAFEASGRWLAIVGSDSDVDLWDVAALDDGLKAIGLAWDQSASTISPSDGPFAGRTLPLPEVAVVRPGNAESAHPPKREKEPKPGKEK